MKKAISLLVSIVLLITLGCACAEKEEYHTGIWKIQEVVDEEFGLPTGEYCIVNQLPIEGTFSNSATSNSDLRVRIIYQRSYSENVDTIDFELYEYQSNRVNNIYSAPKYYSIKVLNSDGEKTELQGGILPQDQDIFLADGLEPILSSPKPIIDALMEGGTVRFSIVERERPLNKYQFVIEDASGFDVAYKMLIEK